MEQNNLASNYSFNYPDSSITNLSQFAPRNFLGNIGLASPNYILEFTSNDLGFQFFNLPVTNDRFYEKQVEYYRSKGPYARLDGIAGAKQLQIFKLFFTHTYRDRVNVTMRFNRYTSLGFYGRQQTYTNNFYISSNYSNKSGRLGYYLYVLQNGNRNFENGGIRNVTLDNSTVLLNKDLLAVRLSSASRDNRQVSAMLNPWWRLNSGQDTVGTVSHYLQVKSRFTNQSLKFKATNDTVNRFYTNYFYNKLNTQDSLHLRQYINEALYTVKNYGGRFALSAGYRHEINQLWQLKDSTFINQLLTADLFVGNHALPQRDSTQQKNYANRLKFQYVMGGPNKGNFKVENNFNYCFNASKKSSVFFNFLTENRNPDFIYNNWNSNHYRWFNNRLKSQFNTQAEAGLKSGELLTLKAFYQNLFRYLYFNAEALPQQYNKSIDNIGISATLSKVFFKHVGIAVQHTFQNSTRPNYIRIPENITSARLFYNGNLFKNNLQLQLGSQVQIYQSFKGYAYAPATQVFYLQNQHSTAAMPFLDIYLHARIRPVTIFINVENILNGAVRINYSFVPGYYQPERALRFGISWTFFD